MIYAGASLDTVADAVKGGLLELLADELSAGVLPCCHHNLSCYDADWVDGYPCWVYQATGTPVMSIHSLSRLQE